MTRVDLKGINTIRRRLATGERRTYYYHRATGLRLEGKPGSVEFIESWQAAERAVKATDRHEGTFAAWINSYRASDDFTLLAEATRKDYLKQIAKIEAEFGDMPLAALRDPAVRAEFLDWRDGLAKRGARQADYAMTVLARVLAWAVNRGLLAVNPAAKPGRRYKSARAEIVWRPADVEAFLAKAAPELALALILARDTAQRQGDLLRLSWTAYDGATISLRQSKRGAGVRSRHSRAKTLAGRRAAKGGDDPYNRRGVALEGRQFPAPMARGNARGRLRRPPLQRPSRNVRYRACRCRLHPRADRCRYRPFAALRSCDSGRLSGPDKDAGQRGYCQARAPFSEAICKTSAKRSQDGMTTAALNILISKDFEVVPGGGFEPPTRGFSIPCSTPELPGPTAMAAGLAAWEAGV